MLLSFKIKLAIVIMLFCGLAITAYIVGCECDVVVSSTPPSVNTLSKKTSPIQRLGTLLNSPFQHQANIKSSKNETQKSKHPLLGRWIGPEGTYLEIVPHENDFQVLIQDLDTLRLFEGKANDVQITFERDGIKETIHASNGDDTGMKWLSGKLNCVTVSLGEGYCRD